MAGMKKRKAASSEEGNAFAKSVMEDVKARLIAKQRKPQRTSNNGVF